jgi:hypothetical protein
MSNIIRFIPKSERERIRLIREARAIYDSIFPPADPVSTRRSYRQVKRAARPIPAAAQEFSRRGHDHCPRASPMTGCSPA